MAKFCSSAILDAAATYLRDHVVKVAVCTSDSTNTVASVQANMLAETTLTTGASTSWAIADSSVSGRKITMTAQSSIAISATGVPQRIALYSSGDNLVYFVTECATDALTSTAGRVTIPAFSIHFYDAT